MIISIDVENAFKLNNCFQHFKWEKNYFFAYYSVCISNQLPTTLEVFSPKTRTKQGCPRLLHRNLEALANEVRCETEIRVKSLRLNKMTFHPSQQGIFDSNKGCQIVDSVNFYSEEHIHKGKTKLSLAS